MMSENRYKYVCLDLDGTLLDSKKRISAVNQKAIVEIHQKGVSFIAATGRHLMETLALLKDFHLLSSFDYVVFADGCGIYDIRKAAVLETFSLTNNDIKAILKVMKRRGNIMAFYNEKNDFFVFDRLSVKNICHVLRNNVLHKSKNRYLYYPFLHLFSWNVEKQKAVLPKLPLSGKNELVNCGLYVLETNQSTEVLPVNKCIALEKLFEKIGACGKEVLYIGDEFNDRECFEFFDSVVMGNAPDRLKQYSLIRAKTNDEDGVGCALYEIFG